MTFFEISFRDGGGVERSLGRVQFSSMEAACEDVRAAIPDAAADLIRSGDDPYPCAFLVRDELQARAEIPFSAVLRPARDGGTGISRAGPAVFDVPSRREPR